MKRLFVLIFICCYFLKVDAQFPTEEQPLGFTLDIAQRAIPSITLPAPDMQKVEEEDALEEKENGGKRVAFPLSVNFSPDNSGYNT